MADTECRACSDSKAAATSAASEIQFPYFQRCHVNAVLLDALRKTCNSSKMQPLSHFVYYVLWAWMSNSVPGVFLLFLKHSADGANAEVVGVQELWKWWGWAESVQVLLPQPLSKGLSGHQGGLPFHNFAGWPSTQYFKTLFICREFHNMEFCASTSKSSRTKLNICL